MFLFYVGHATAFPNLHLVSFYFYGEIGSDLSTKTGSGAVVVGGRNHKFDPNVDATHKYAHLISCRPLLCIVKNA